jgi:hypothetical protein
MKLIGVLEQRHDRRQIGHDCAHNGHLTHVCPRLRA